MKKILIGLLLISISGFSQKGFFIKNDTLWQIRGIKVGDTVAFLSNRQGGGSGTTIVNNNVAGDYVPICGIKFAGTTVTYFGNSITQGVGATNPSNRWTSILSRKLGVTESNRGIGGSLLEKGTPVNPFGGAGPNMIDNLSTVPVKDSAKSLLVISYGINDAGYTAGNYTPENFYLAYDSVMKYITITKGWPVENILLVAPSFMSDYNIYTSWGVPATSEARLLSFIDQVKAISTKWKTLYVAPFYPMKNNGGAILLKDGLHPNDKGHDFIANLIYTYLSPEPVTQIVTNVIKGQMLNPKIGDWVMCSDCIATDGSTGVMQVWNGSTWKNTW